MPHYELEVADGNDKYWEITLDGKSFIVRFWRDGETPQTQRKKFASEADAKKAYDKLIAEKVKQGFKHTGESREGKAAQVAATARDRVASAVVAAKRNPELEKAIEDNPYDTAAYSVLADWLQANGDPRGELIALQLGGKKKQAEALLASHEAYFYGPLAEHKHTYDGDETEALTWKYGFIHAARLSHDYYGDEEWKGTLGEVLELLLAHPSGRFLAELTFVFNRDPNEDDLQDLIDILVERSPRSLRKLHFGDYEFAGPSSDTATGNTEISWYSIGDLSKLWRAVPKLRTLITQCGSSQSTISNVGLKLGKLDLPELVHAEFRTGGLERANARAIAAGRFPAIEHLEIWYGQEEYGGDATVADVTPLLARTDLPKLRRLGLRNAKFADELISELAHSPLLPKLRVLDLSLGCLTDAGAQQIANHRDAFAHLDELDVNDNYLTDSGLRALAGCAKKITSEDQREVDDPDDPDSRYPSVGE